MSQTMRHYTIIDFCSGRHEVLLTSKLHIDRRETEVSMNRLLFNNNSFSQKQKLTVVLLYKKYISVERAVIW